MLRQEKLFSADNEMKTGQDKRRIKSYTYRMTAVICSGLLAFGSSLFYVGGSVCAAAKNSSESVQEIPGEKEDLSQAADSSRKETLTDLLPERTKGQNSLLKDYANEWRQREYTYKISEKWEKELSERVEEITFVENGRYAAKEQMRALKNKLNTLLEDADGTWSIYVKDLQSRVSFSIHNKEMYAASLIKLFVMEKCLSDYKAIIANDAKTSGDEEYSKDRIDTLLSDMIEVSDNEAYNELVKIQNADRDFAEGAEEINCYLKAQEYTDTGLYHTLHPAWSEYEWISEEQNHTSAKDCGLLLERIYDGECVSEKASAKMLELLLNQQVIQKIPQGLPEDGPAVCANKTGETDTDHHDAAIVFGPKTDYVLCVMSSEWEDSNEAVMTICEISKIVYETLNDDT